MNHMNMFRHNSTRLIHTQSLQNKTVQYSYSHSCTDYYNSFHRLNNRSPRCNSDHSSLIPEHICYCNIRSQHRRNNCLECTNSDKSNSLQPRNIKGAQKTKLETLGRWPLLCTLFLPRFFPISFGEWITTYTYINGTTIHGNLKNADHELRYDVILRMQGRKKKKVTQAKTRFTTTVTDIRLEEVLEEFINCV